eukprot:435170-Pyramimonas_sp.AAC.1
MANPLSKAPASVMTSGSTGAGEQQAEGAPDARQRGAQLAVLVLDPVALVDRHRVPVEPVREEGFTVHHRLIRGK